ncbi:MAG: hypothetical protein COA69_05995 [Robiginitomaculum sp.]|nr:MAG: hypothetical protein COA69_05995 [Robiginitomaculum sp.]
MSVLHKILNSILFSISVLVFSSPALAGPLCALGQGGHGGADIPATPLAHQQMRSVAQALCQKFKCPYFDFAQTQTTKNAMAWSDASGNYIRYNSSFMNGELQNRGFYATTGILAHELGHLIDFSVNTANQNQATREATADRYAGCAFALAGEPRENLLALAQSLQAMGSSPGYPTAQERVALVLIGYNQCSN